MTTSTSVRVRFAPSPTGFLHVGGLRTALYNYLFARQQGGTFILRIEDTDRTRYVEGAVDNLIQTLAWAGLDFDEGPGKEGSCGPYVQSERSDIYREHVNDLLAKDKAYHCFCTPERLEEVRKQQAARGEQSKYDKHCLLQLTKDERETKALQGVPHVVRMKVDPVRVVSFSDIVREQVEFSTDQIDDQVLLKSDGYPTYHLANVVDDHLMGITHVIRGEEWLSSTPKHVLLYEYFGWALPQFAHLPLLLNPDRSKLSKRQGDVAVEDYRAKGYLKEALVNFVALLGWNPGTEQEIFEMPELIQQFSLERVNKSGAIFNIEKLNWLNFEHLRRKKVGEILSMLRVEMDRVGIAVPKLSDDYLIQVIEAMRDRVNFVRDFVDHGSYFFRPPATYDEESIKKRWKDDTPDQIRSLIEAFGKLINPTKDQYEKALQETAASLGIGAGKLIHPVRLAVSGVSGGPGLYDILLIIGKEETIRRLQTALERITVVTTPQ